MGIRFCWIILFSALLTAAPVQDDSQEREIRPSSDGPQNNSHLRKYPFVEELVDKANKAIQAGKWNDALDIYIQAMGKYPDHVIASGEDSHFLSVRQYCINSISRWPEEGRQAYQLRFDPVVKHYFDRAKATRDAVLLKTLASSHPFSSYSDDVLSLLANLALDRNSPREAVDLLERLAVDPGDVSRASILARLGSAYYLLRDRAGLAGLVEKVQKDHLGESVIVRDRNIRLLDHLKELLAEVPRVDRSLSEETSGWKMMGGHPSGVHLPNTLSRFPRLAWSHAFASIRPSADEYEFMIAGSTMVKPLHPAVSEGVVYLHNGTSAYAFNMFSRGKEPPLWTFRVAPMPVLFEERIAYSTTVHEGKIFVNLVTGKGEEERRLGGIYVKIPFPKRTLFALDAYSGKEAWRIGGGAVDPQRFEDGLSFSMAPTPEADALYVPGIRQIHPTDPFEQYVTCLDPASGQTRWTCYIASGLTEINLFGNSTREALPSPVTVSGDTLFTLTNFGSVAALDKSTGALRWVYQYEHVQVPYTRSISVVHLPLEWTLHAPIAAHGQLLFAPLDSPFLFALDQKSGRLKWKIRRPADAHTVFGIHGSTLILGGTQLYFYDILAEGKLIHTESLSRSDGLSRGAITDRAVYVPSASKIAVIDPKTFKLLDEIPWSLDRGANLLVADYAVVATTPEGIHVYFDQRAAEKELLEELSRDPENPERVYRLALTMVQMGRDREAMEQFQKSARLVQDWDPAYLIQIRSASLRRMALLAMKIGRDRLASGDLAEAESLFRMALAHSIQPSSTVEASLALAEVLQSRQKAAEALDVYQGLIRQRGQDLYEGRPMRETIRTRVAGLLKESGREVYQRYEKEAAELKSRAVETKSADQLLEVMKLYPNSVAAEEACLDVARLQVESQEPSQAANTLREFLRQFPESAYLPQASVDLVGLLEQQKLFLTASSVLKELAGKSPDAKVQIGRERKTVREFVDAQLKRPEYQIKHGTGAVVTVRTPLVRKWSVADRNAGSLQVIRPAWQDVESVEYLFFHLGTAVRAVSKKDGATMWEAVLPNVPYKSFVLGESLILIGYSYVIRIDQKSGKSVWTYAPDQRFLSRPVVGGNVILVASQRLDGNPGIEVVSLNLADGNPLWSRTYEDMSSPIFPVENWVGFSTPNKLVVLDAGTGAVRAEQDLSVSGFPASLVYADAASLCCYSNTKWIASHDPATGKLRWQHSIDGMQLLSVEANREFMVYLSRPINATGGGKAHMTVVSMETGKLVSDTDLEEADASPVVKVTSESIFVIARTREQTPAIRAVSPKTLKTLWSTEVKIAEPFFNTLAPVIMPEHVLLPYIGRDEQRNWAYHLDILDRLGNRVQSVASEKGPKPPRGEMVGESLLIQTDTMIELYSGGK